MGKLIFVTGGCRSGKSTLALDLAKKRKGRTAFIATAVGIDGEMRRRIKDHKSQRPAEWKTFEQPYAVSGLLGKIGADFDTIILDCVTVYLTNLLVKKYRIAEIEEEIQRVILAIKEGPCRCIIVSNEVGMGIVPATGLGRKFRDLAGGVNKQLAAAADEMYLLVSGIPLRIKNGKIKTHA